MTQLRVLCVGAGYFSQFHLEAWRRIPEVTLVGICDLDASRAQTQANAFHIPAVRSDPVAAIAECRPDVIDIITRPDSHLELVQLAVSHQLPVICQKPIAPDFLTAVKIVNTVNRAEIPFMVHENFRFQPWHREIKKLLTAGVIGDRIHGITVRSRMGDGHGDNAYLSRQPYFRDMPKLLVHETGVHFIDTMRYLAGEIDEVYAILRRLNPVIAGEDAGILTLRFANGAVGVWDANRYNESTSPNPRLTLGEFQIEATGGTIRLDHDGRLTTQPLGKPIVEHDYAFTRTGFSGDCVYFTQRHFVEQLLSHLPFETNGLEYLKTLSIQEAAYLSASENRPVRIAEIHDAINTILSAEAK